MDKKEELKKQIKDFPQSPGSYLMKNDRGQVIYVGKAKDIRARVRSYFTSSKDQSLKTQFLVGQIDHIEYILTKTEVEAFLLEASLIKKYRPRYNIRLKDDKSYPYIRCSVEVDFPRFYLCRKVKSDGALYFGPYTSGLAVRETIRFLNRTFKIRDCTDAFMKARKRACMTHQIGRCTAPCVDYISKEDYGTDVDSALELLRGKDKKLLKSLQKKMKEASKEERFEAAAKVRDSIQAVKTIWQKQTVVSEDLDLDQDVISFCAHQSGTLIETLHIRNGRVIGSRPHFIAKLNVESEAEDEKEWFTSFLNQYYAENIIPDEIILPLDLGGDIIGLLQDVFEERQSKRPKVICSLDVLQRQLMDMSERNAKSHLQDIMAKRDHRLKGLEEIQQKLKLPVLPLRIECFDISNFQGKESVASQVVFEEGVPKKDDYRRYKIRSVEGPNDFASMKEVLERRLKHTEYEDPHLIVVDGGKGQLKMATEILKELGRVEIPVVGLAKARVEGEFKDKEVKGSQERFFLPGRQNPVTFSAHSEAHHILIGIRDEAHRFAITYHRKLRDKKSIESELDSITGLGEKRKKTLLKKFQDLDGIRGASVDEIAKLSSFNRVLAERILLALSGEE
jgi:excinuclease ABC subunit C